MPCLPSVCRWICISGCLPQHRRQTTPGWTVCQRQLVVPWLWWPQWCTPPLHHEPFWFYSKFLNLLPGFNKKNNQRRPLTSREFLPPSWWISCNSAVHFHCRVCTSQKKYFGLWHWHWRRLCHCWSRIYLRCCHSLWLWQLANCPFKPQFLPGLQLLRWEGDHAHVCFCGTCFFIYSLHRSPYQPFKNRADKPFHLPVLWIYPCFDNYLRLPWHFLLITKYWAKDCRQHDKNWHICCCFSLSCTVSSFKNVSLWLGLA